jgi:hypothetical protein
MNIICSTVLIKRKGIRKKRRKDVKVQVSDTTMVNEEPLSTTKNPQIPPTAR